MRRISHINSRAKLLLIDIEEARMVCPVAFSNLEQTDDSLVRIHVSIFNRLKKSRFSVTFEFNVNEPLYPFGQLNHSISKEYGSVR